MQRARVNVLLALLGLWANLFGCTSVPAAPAPRPPPASPPATTMGAEAAQEPSMPTLPHGAVVLQGATGPLRYDVELALDPESQERGLMFRKEVPDGTGMLFVFPKDGPRTFWMKNTLVPLDLLFISAAGKVVGLIENAEPLTLTPRPSGQPARYVLELAGGTAFAKGIRLGSAMSFEAVP